jgi:hypothetical protein
MHEGRCVQQRGLKHTPPLLPCRRAAVCHCGGAHSVLQPLH